MISQLGSAPNLLTLLRLIFVPVTVIAVIEGKYGWALALFCVVLLCAAAYLAFKAGRVAGTL